LDIDVASISRYKQQPTRPMPKEMTAADSSNTGGHPADTSEQDAAGARTVSYEAVMG
jgi:hypothetical protein